MKSISCIFFHSISFILLDLICILFSVEAELSVCKIIMRVPNEHDIGLIFDLTVRNEGKEPYSYQVKPDGTCTLTLPCKQEMNGASKIVGGDFGFIQPGESDYVSLIWPTVSLYNRLGRCPIQITYSTTNKDEQKITQDLQFDTTFETLDPDNRTLRKLKDYKDCKNFDKEYLKNCTPVDCEERYFGRRSFYNKTSEHCEEVPQCKEAHEYYDLFSNECMNPSEFLTDQDIADIKSGKYSSNYIELQPAYQDASEPYLSDQDEEEEQKWKRYCENPTNSQNYNHQIEKKHETTTKPEHVKTPKTESENSEKSKCEPPTEAGCETSPITELETSEASKCEPSTKSECDSTTNTECESTENTECETPTKPECDTSPVCTDWGTVSQCESSSAANCTRSTKPPSCKKKFDHKYWLKGIINGLLIVIATIAIYILICFFIYLIASWFSHTKCTKRLHKQRLARHEDAVPLPHSTPSIMSSHR